jgi:rubrerythrin
MNAKTRENLLTAMHGEAFAYAKYMLFAKRARENGHPEIAELFEKTANVEFLEHFTEEAELAKIVGTDIENLKDAIKGERYEVKEMYKEFADQAEKAHEKAAAERFLEVRRDEMAHKEAFREALARLEAKPLAKKAPRKVEPIGV